VLACPLRTNFAIQAAIQSHCALGLTGITPT
jgi:hypothetical protein